MTREAKIGMLTGLGVIVLIGVLLSSYLGDGGRVGVSPLAAAANRMAPLPAGEVYRQQQLQPVGVPAMTPGGHKVKLADGTEVLSPIDTTQAVPAAMAVDVAPSGPVVGPAVAAVPTGPMPVARENVSVPPTFEMTDRLFDASLKDSKVAVSTAAPTAPTSVSYTVVAGDNLAKIAKKFYNSSKNSDIVRIVKANPTMLKDANTPLMVNKKLVIPAVASASAAPVIDTSRVDGVVVYRPGDAAVVAPMNAAIRKVERPSSTVAPASAPKNEGARTAAPAPAAKTYVVQSGDSLEKIARRIAPSKVNETMQKLMSLNGIKNAGALQAGAKIKLPA